MGDLLKMAEQLTKNPQSEAINSVDKAEGSAPKITHTVVKCNNTFQQKEEKPMSKDERPATRKQKGWIYYNLKLSTYSLQISMKDMSVLIERSQRSKEEKAKVQFRLRQMGAKECK